MATQSSFKQQCPSCEAMVPIRDPKLIGRKIDCPKCKYRFIVEEPVDEVEELDEGAADKKGKPAKAAPGKRRADDDEDLEESRPKKKQGSSGMLIGGIVLAAVAVIALAVGGYYLLSDDSDESKPSTNRPSTTAPPPVEQEKKVDATKPDTGPKPLQDDITNLLPNNTQVVINLPVEHLFGNPKINQALLKTPGAFHEDSFRNTWGVLPTEVRRVVLSYNVENKTVFSVMRTSAQMQEAQIAARLKLKPQTPINGLKYYLVTKPMGALTTLLLKGGEHHDNLALHFPDSFTVVCADTRPMNQFLQEKGQPKRLSAQPVDQEESAAQGGAAPGGGQPAGGQQAMQEMMQRRMQGGGRPGGGGPPAGMQGGGQTPPTPGGRPGPGGPGGNPMQGMGNGGYRPPNSIDSGMAPSSMTGGSTSSGAVAATLSYLTIDKHLKAVLDQAERVDKNENQNVLLSIGMTTSGISVEDIKKGMAQQGNTIPQLPDFALKVFLDSFRSQLKAMAVAVTDFSESKVSVNAAAGAKDSELAQRWEKFVSDNLAGFLESSGLDLIAKNTNSNNAPNNSMQGMSGGMPGGGMGMMGGGQGNQMTMQRMQQQMMMQRRMQGSGGPGGGMMPPPNPMGGPMAGTQQSQTNGEKTEEKGKLGNYEIWAKDTVVAGGVNLNLTPTQYRGIGEGLEGIGIYLRGLMAMTEHASHIHELAAAMQDYFGKNGRFPRGTVARPFDSERFIDWRPDQRLSWMTEILPYLANGEYNDLKPVKEKGWYDDMTNVKIGLTVIPHFVAPYRSKDNPLYFYVKYPNLPVKGPGMWAATHFVGMAGVGLDAADYDGAKDSPHAKKRGVFGYDRQTTKKDITDGLDQTIVLIQVPPEPKSPWIAGGGSTVRGVSEDLDCVQPFVCTEHEGKRGTFAIMADGKVRFIPATIDPKTFQALCTIAGGDRVKNLDKIAPEVPAPEGLTDQPELKADPAAPPTPLAPPVARSSVPSGWQEVNSKEGRYHILVPAGKLEDLSESRTFPEGRITVHQFRVQDTTHRANYVVGYADLPHNVAASADQLLEGTRSGVLRSTPGGKVVGTPKKITVDGNPGQEFQIEIGGKVRLTGRVYVVKDREYTLLAGGPQSDIPPKDLQTFFDSFRITK